MKYLPLGLSIIAGGALGAAVKWSSSGKAGTPPADAAPTKIARELPTTSLGSLPPSSDTLDDLKNKNLPHRTTRLAIWLETASVKDIAILWESFISDNSTPNVLQELLMGRWVALDPQGAMAAVKDTRATSFFWSAWAEADPQAAYKAASTSDDKYALSTVLKVLALKDPDYVLKLLETSTDKRITANGVSEGFLAQRKFEKAIDADRRFGQGSKKDNIIREWGKEDPEAVLLWAAQSFDLLPSYNDDDGILIEITRLHTDKIPGILGKLPGGNIKLRLQKTYAVALAEKDPEAAVTFVSQIDPAGQKPAVLAAIGATLSRSKPDMATSAFRQLLDEGITFDKQVRNVYFPSGTFPWKDDSPLCEFADTLVKQIPGATLDELMAAGNEQRYLNAADQISESWMEQDAWDFSAWLKKQPSGIQRDRFAVSLANHIVHDSKPAFPEAADWIASINDAAVRNHELRSLLSRWESSAPDTLKTYLASPSTPETVRKLAASKED